MINDFLKISICCVPGTLPPPGPVVSHDECLREVPVAGELGWSAHDVVGGVGDARVAAVLRGEVQHLAHELLHHPHDVRRLGLHPRHYSLIIRE